MTGKFRKAFAALAMALAGIWRYFDGSDHRPKGSNIIVMVLAAVTVLILYGWSWPHWFAGAVAVASVLVGRTDWSDYTHMIIRYTLPALIAVNPGVWLKVIGLESAALYTGLCFAVGVVYPTVNRLGVAWADGVARTFAGVAVVGALSLL